MKVCLGGTFHPLHVGHEALLARAFREGEEVLIGLTSDALTAEKEGEVASFADRRENLEAFLQARGWRRYRIARLEDPYGPAAHEADLDAIVVSEETEETARELNAVREERGLRPLAVIRIPLVPAQDGRPITSTRIRRGEVDREGRLLRPVRVRVGSRNPVKVEAARRVLESLFDASEVVGVDVESGVPDQPAEEDAWKGALRRAREARGDADLGVGIEAGLVRPPGGAVPFDVQYCAVVDRGGRVTVGSGPGFVHPPRVLDRVVAGETVGAAMETLTGVADIGRKEGAIGYLTEGRMDRRELTEIAVFMAMVPRMRPALYAEGDDSREPGEGP